MEFQNVGVRSIERNNVRSAITFLFAFENARLTLLYHCFKKKKNVAVFTVKYVENLRRIIIHGIRNRY